MVQCLRAGHRIIQTTMGPSSSSASLPSVSLTIFSEGNRDTNGAKCKVCVDSWRYVSEKQSKFSRTPR